MTTVAGGVGSGCGANGSASGVGPVTVLAASSLTTPLTTVKPELVARHHGLRVTYSFAGSQSLVRQIESGAPADVVATADPRTMQALVDARLVDPPVVLARNRLSIVVAPGNPKHVTGLADLARADVTVVLADPSVPVGGYAEQALRRAAVNVKPRSLELDVSAALSKVTSGEADAAIVYETDVKAAGRRATGVAIPDADNVIATYPVAVVKATRHRAAARVIIDELLHGAGRRALARAGFVVGP